MKIERCCIIDDDPIFIYGTKRIMKEMNFCEDIIVFNNGQSALEGITRLIANNSKFPDCIFLDINMPIMNGWEFLDQFTTVLEPNKHKTTVYLISSSIDMRDLDRVKKYDIVQRYILKPITSSDLEELLNTMPQQ